MSEFGLKCDISEGQFSGEFAVSGEDAGGKAFSLFAREQDVDHQRSLLRIEQLAKGNGMILVRLPEDTLENGNTVTVRQEQLQKMSQRELARDEHSR